MIDIRQFSFVAVDPLQKAPFCVDGRKGKVEGEVYGPYPQMLGGSLMSVVLEWLMNKPEQNLSQVLPEVFKKLKDQGYPLGVHTSTHAHEGKSDCGFADNLGKILLTFNNNFDQIKEIIRGLGGEVNEVIWKKIKEQLGKVNLTSLPSGKSLIDQAIENGAI
ncbi:MAG: hypothetical protein ACPL1D_03005, partial [Microgenomates group bacterium]